MLTFRCYTLVSLFWSGSFYSFYSNCVHVKKYIAKLPDFVILCLNGIHNNKSNGLSADVEISIYSRTSQMSRHLVVDVTRHHRPSALPVRCSVAVENVYTKSGGVMETETARMAVMKQTAVRIGHLSSSLLSDLFFYVCVSMFVNVVPFWNILWVSCLQ